NPSPGYIQRVAIVFNNNGFGVRGDLKAVITAILTDAEARNDAAPQNSGRVKDSIQQIVGFARALNGQINASNGLPWEFSLEAETPLTPPSVFSFYSPLYHVPKSPLFGPEFQIYTPTEAVERGNFLWQIISNPATDFTVSLAPFNAAAGNLAQLIDAVGILRRAVLEDPNHDPFHARNPPDVFTPRRCFDHGRRLQPFRPDERAG